MRHIPVPFLSLLLLSQLYACAPVGSDGLGEETMIFLVRHAERADDAGADPGMVMDPQMREDPALSAPGEARAALLAEILVDAGLTHIHSTDYRRTLDTSAPAAEETGIEIALYDADELSSFAEFLKETPGRHLVVGHSNTTWELVGALGGDPGSPIDPLEYDRLYLVSVGKDRTETVLIRYGLNSGESGG